MFTTRNLLRLIGHHVLIAIGWMTMSVAVVLFLSHEIKSIATASYQSHSLANTLGKRADLLTTLKYDSEVVGDDDVAIEQAFPSSDNILGFIETLEKLGIKHGATQKTSFGTPTLTEINAGVPIAAVSYNINFTAPLASIILYLKDFESLPYFTKIDSINVAAASKEGISQPGTVALHAIVYTKAAQ